MEEIDAMLNQWIHSTIIRKKLRDLISQAIQDAKPKRSPIYLDQDDYVDEDED